MGVIEGGTVAGIVPDERFFAVNYPGYPSSLARATHTLGGEETIAKARSCDGTYLELKFRPEDPYAHAAFGEVHQTSDLLLRIKRRCSRRSSGTRSSTTTNSAAAMVSAGLRTIASSSPDDASRRDSAERNNGAADYEVHADIVARIENTYNFDGMADYQYVLAVHADAAKRSHKRKRDEQRFEKGGLMDMEQEELMMLVPPLFSLKDIPEETVSYFFHFVHVASIFCNVVLIPLIQVPAPTQWEEKLVQGSVEYQLTAVVAHYFDKQPIWARASLTDCLADQGLTLTTFQIKRLLFRTAFYFGYGPFRTLWIKNGYDPRKDPESRMYQMMDFRIPRAVRENGHAPERPQKDPEWRDICSFRVAPQKKFSHLQLHDLQDDFIQEQIRKPAERSSCSEYTGWFRRATLERIRQHIRVRFLALIPGEVARELELVEARSLQRFKSGKGISASTGMENLQDEENMRCLVPVKEHELPGEDNEEDAEVELGKGGEDEEDEEDEEDVEDDEVLIIGDSTDKIPDGFLQELLQRFPFAGSSSPMPGNGQATTEDVRSEDEYAIYEQDDEDDD
ncbi:unnamed protein product [Sphagnum jensenii]|uniref:Transcription factor IIIC subunit 5 HTH domain-containing protein n=1 Tax=Sphagnum jensenii TaxID=128206 RepID=A0ABP1BJY0_9BRYO